MYKELEKEYYASQKHYTKKELLEIFPEAIPYLEESRKECFVWIDAFETIINYQLKNLNKIKDEFSRWFWIEVLGVQDGAILEKYEKRLKELNLFLNPWPAKEGGITDEDILRAKEYPFENLIKVNQAKFAVCPFHGEKTASFCIKKNFGYCFGCAWSGDTIKFVMETEGVGFVKAVKMLI